MITVPASRPTATARSPLAITWVAESRQRREQRLRRMTVIAEAAQRAILRATPSEIDGVGLAARYVSASAEALIGGDLYDVAATDHGVRLIIGDVRGKGIDAVQLAAAVLGAFRQSAFRRRRLGDVVTDLDAVVATVGGDEDFVTALLAEFRDDGTVALVNCGHHPPLLAAPMREPMLIRRPAGRRRIRHRARRPPSTPRQAHRETAKRRPRRRSHRTAEPPQRCPST